MSLRRGNNTAPARSSTLDDNLSASASCFQHPVDPIFVHLAASYDDTIIGNVHYDHSSSAPCQLLCFQRILRISACFRIECESSNRQPIVSIN